MAYLFVVFYHKDTSFLIVGIFFCGAVIFLGVYDIHLFRVGRVYFIWFRIFAAAREFVFGVCVRVLRQIYGEYTTFALFAHQFYTSVMQFHQTLYQ